jgi:carbamoyltransferase
MKKLLSVVVVEHDSNISYFNGKELHYIKLERLKQIKHYCYPTFWDWKYDIKKLWNVDLEDIDEIVVDFSHKIYSDENLPSSMKSVLTGDSNYTLVSSDIDYLHDIVKHVNLIDKKIPVWYISHHYAHSLSTWMLTDRTPDVSIVIDGLGDARTWSVFRNNKLIDSGSLESGSIGFEMVRAGRYLGIKNSHEVDIAGKVMGLQSYGSIDYEYLNFLRNFNFRQIQEIFNHDHWVIYKKDELLARLTPLDWIRTVHYRMGEVLVDFFGTYAKKNELISYSGGVAQNVIWNTEIRKHFPNLLIPPHSGDEGLSLGAIEWLRKKNNLPRFELKNFPYSQNDFPPNDKLTKETIKKTAKLLSEGKIVGWYQGHGEIGPRALGNRSILFDPRIVNGKEKVNSVKKREQFRPFGASVLKEYANNYFDIVHDDEYMLYVSKVLSSEFESITHIDGTCRIQTVENDSRPFRQLLEEFYQLTGCPILLNTSLNIAGFPLASYPEIVIDIFKSTSIDAVVIGNKIYLKEHHNDHES